MEFYDSSDVFFELNVLQMVILLLVLFPTIFVSTVDWTMGESDKIFNRMVITKVRLSF